jgi:hypothetical protein
MAEDILSEHANETKKVELIEKFAEMSKDKDNGASKIKDLLSDELEQGSLPFPKFGNSYDGEEFFVDLLNNSVLHYSTAANEVKQARLLGTFESERSQKIIRLYEQAQGVANDADGYGTEGMGATLKDIESLIKNVKLIADELQAEINQREEDYEPIIDEKQEIRNIYDNPTDRSAYQNAIDTNQFEGTWEEWMFGKESKNE